MIHDSERREVARRLRDSLTRCSRDDFGDEFEWFTETVCGPIDTLHQMELEDVIARLADLIEPSGHECVPGECPLNIRHDNDRIDRDALLELAVNLDARATELLKVNDLDQSRQRRSARLAHATDLMAACNRIREALGVK